MHATVDGMARGQGNCLSPFSDTGLRKASILPDQLLQNTSGFVRGYELSRGASQSCVRVYRDRC